MAFSLNLCVYIGYVGADPEVKRFDNGDEIVNFRIAVGESYKKRDGEKAEHTEWVACVGRFPHIVDSVDKYMRKGDPVAVVGKQRTRKWTDRDGNDRYQTEIIVADWQSLTTKESRESKARDERGNDRGRDDRGRDDRGRDDRGRDDRGRDDRGAARDRVRDDKGRDDRGRDDRGRDDRAGGRDRGRDDRDVDEPRGRSAEGRGGRDDRDAGGRAARDGKASRETGRGRSEPAGYDRGEPPHDDLDDAIPF